MNIQYTTSQGLKQLVPSSPVQSGFLGPFSNNWDQDWFTIVQYSEKPGPDCFRLVNCGLWPLLNWFKPVKIEISDELIITSFIAYVVCTVLYRLSNV